MINCNPETVSTDYDTADRLYFEPLTGEDVLEIIDTERQNGTLHAGIMARLERFAGQLLALREVFVAIGFLQCRRIGEPRLRRLKPDLGHCLAK